MAAFIPGESPPLVSTANFRFCAAVMAFPFCPRIGESQPGAIPSGPIENLPPKISQADI
jgi:hypothetical protein